MRQSFLYQGEKMKFVKITVHSVIENVDERGIPEDEPEISISTHSGSLRDEGEILHLGYTEEGEGGNVECHIVIYPDGGVSLSRRGAIVSDILFKEGEECHTVYSIPPYKFDMTVYTKRVRSDMSAEGGILRLLYSMNVGGQEKKVQMKITVK